MKANFTISEEDYVKAIKLSMKFTRRDRAIFVVIAIVMGVMLFAGSPWMKTLSSGALMGGCLVYLLLTYVSPYHARKQYRKFPAIRVPFTLAMEGDGIVYSSEHGETRLTWDRIKKWREDDDFILVYLTAKLCHIIPKRAEGIDVVELTTQLHNNVGDPW